MRRGRLPEPGEILFCSATTTAEDVELLLRRFLFARAYGRADAFFVLANAHALSYAIQVRDDSDQIGPSAAAATKISASDPC